MSNMMSQAGGSAATMAMGQGAQMNAYQQGTQQAAMKGAAETQIKTGQMQQGMGGINAAMGALQLYKYMQHNKHGKEITAGSSSGVTVDQLAADGSNATTTEFATGQAGFAHGAGDIQNRIIDRFQMNNKSDIDIRRVEGNKALTATLQEQQKFAKTFEERQKDINTHTSDVKSNMRRIGNTAASEQSSAAQAALAGGMMSLMTGSQQLMSGSFSVAAGNRMLGVANQLSAYTGSKAPIMLPPTLSNNIAGGALTSRGPATITGSGTQGSEASTDSAPTTPEDPGADLGNGFGPNAVPSGIPNGPSAGNFNVGGSKDGGGGGGGGVSGGGSTAAASGGQEDPQAKLAPTQGGAGYESGGAFTGGGAGGGKGSDGPDLSGLLAKFLPQKDDSPTNQNGILDYGSKGPAETPDGSILGKGGPTLFQRATSTYRDKYNHGNVGP